MEDIMVVSNRHIPQATFAYRADGEILLDCMRDIADKFGVIRLQDYCDLANITCDAREMAFIKPYLNFGYWTSEDLKNASCRKTSGRPSFYLCLPNFRINREDYYKVENDSINTEELFDKEDKNMATRYNYNTTCNPSENSDIPRVSSLEFEDPIEVEFEKKKKDLVDEAEKKILDIRQELATALDKLRSEQHERRMEETERSQAKAWKRKYDALIEAGFSEDQAWQMTMESFKID